ncbi:MAG: DinB family protein [Chloroflexi bacterium]|nr:DinB family protein [Chloroflexota bacterium]
MVITFTPDQKPVDIQDNYTRDDLIAASNESIDYLLNLIRDLPDSYVTFQPEDPEAHDAAAATEGEVNMAWTLGHVIAHITASSEEDAALGAALARGVEVKWRSRYETPWEELTTIEQLIQRLEESRRIRLAYLDAWPDQPKLETAVHKSIQKRWGPMNAVGYTLLGLGHEIGHYGQLEEIIAQARAALG